MVIKATRYILSTRTTLKDTLRKLTEAKINKTSTGMIEITDITEKVKWVGKKVAEQ